MNQLKTVGAAILKRHGFFSVDQIIRDTKISRKYCRDVLGLFCQEGIIKEIRRGRKEHIFGKPPIYAIIYRANRQKLVTRIAPQRMEGTVQDRIWYVMRNKFKSDGSFNLRDLILLAGANRNMVRWYLKALHRGGYIAPSRRAGPGVEWRLTGDFGPQRPYLQYPSKAERKRHQKMAPSGPLS